MIWGEGFGYQNYIFRIVQLFQLLLVTKREMRRSNTANYYDVISQITKTGSMCLEWEITWNDRVVF